MCDVKYYSDEFTCCRYSLFTTQLIDGMQNKESEIIRLLLNCRSTIITIDIIIYGMKRS